MRFDVFTTLPAMFEGPLTQSIVRRAVERGILSIHVHDLRNWTTDRHRSTDDYPYGGGAGMVMKPEPIFRAVEEVVGADPEQRGDTPIVLLTPAGETFTQRIAERLAGLQRLALICGHYEGVDDRVRQGLATMELSIGDYVLSGGEIASAVVVDAVARLVPGVIQQASHEDESRHVGPAGVPTLHPPRRVPSVTVPDVLLSATTASLTRGGWSRRCASPRPPPRPASLLEAERRAPTAKPDDDDPDDAG
ncbi:MAG: tRNA (guanosine(37)-N1)-methyltransferase TrmD [Chloroflexia bacterium]